MSDTDRIEKTIHIKAPRARVWRALTDASEFSAWFLVDLEGTFEVGTRVEGQSTYPGCEHLRLAMTVERMDAEHLFSFRWNPEDEEPADPKDSVTTLVEFRLEAVDSGTVLTVIESGFDQLPPPRRAIAFRQNEKGWGLQVENIRRYVSS